MKQHLQRLSQLRRQRRAGAAAAAAASVAGEPPLSAEALPAAEPQGAQSRKTSLFPMQINLDAEDVALRFEHHPLEVRPCWLPG